MPGFTDPVKIYVECLCVLPGKARITTKYEYIPNSLEPICVQILFLNPFQFVPFQIFPFCRFPRLCHKLQIWIILHMQITFTDRRIYEYLQSLLVWMDRTLFIPLRPEEIIERLNVLVSKVGIVHDFPMLFQLHDQVFIPVLRFLSDIGFQFPFPFDKSYERSISSPRSSKVLKQFQMEYPVRDTTL